jgi:hypothetical protein
MKENITYVIIEQNEIYNLIDLVEDLGASKELTDIVVKLSDIALKTAKLEHSKTKLMDRLINKQPIAHPDSRLISLNEIAELTEYIVLLEKELLI